MDTISTQAGTCIQRATMPNCAGVSARIKANSNPAKAATATAPTANTRFARAARSFHQTMNWRNASIRHAPAPIDQTTVTQLMAFVSEVVQVYTTGRWIGKTLNISETSYEFSELTTRSHQTLVLLSIGERFAKLTIGCHEAALSRDPTEPAALAAGVRPDCARGRETQPRSAHAALRSLGARDFAAGCSAKSCDGISRGQNRRFGRRPAECHAWQSN